MHVEALQRPNCIFEGRLRANCHKLHELGNAKNNAWHRGLAVGRRATNTGSEQRRSARAARARGVLGYSIMFIIIIIIRLLLVYYYSIISLLLLLLLLSLLLCLCLCLLSSIMRLSLLLLLLLLLLGESCVLDEPAKGCWEYKFLVHTYTYTCSVKIHN